MAVSQLSGTLDYQLIPRKQCKDICKTLKARLEIYHTRKYIVELFISNYYRLTLIDIFAVKCLIVFFSDFQ